MSDHYEDVVINYLRADRALFINTQCFIQIEDGNAPKKGTSWYCDALTVDLRSSSVFLCEVSYSETLAALCTRLTQWSGAWNAIRSSLVTHSKVHPQWSVRPWLFVPEKCVDRLVKYLRGLEGADRPALRPLLTPLEMTVPWAGYKTWDRQAEDVEQKKKKGVPEDMRW